MGFSAVMAVMAAVSSVMSYSQAQQQQQAQQKQRDFQEAMLRRNAAISEQNAQMAEEEGRDQRREAYDEAQRKRRETAQMVGRERAMSAFSGAQVDQGSSLDLTADMAERGAIDAFNTERAGDLAQHRQQVRAWEARLQSEGQNLQAQALSLRQPQTSFLNSALSQGKNYFSLLNKDKPDATNKNKPA